MKKLSALIISALLFTGMLGLNTGAAAAEQKNQTLVSQTTEYFEDGSSVIISVYEDDMPATRAGTFTKSGSKTYTMKNNSGKKLWSFTLNGSFSVNSGVSSSCTSSSYSSKIEDDAWSLKTASAVKSGNKAVGDATYQAKFLFIVTDTKSCHIELKCDVNGNLS